MRRSGSAPWLAAPMLPGIAVAVAAVSMAAVSMTALPGCANNSMALQGRVNRFEQQQLALTNQNRLLQQRADALDQDNQELQTLLAQSRQQANMVEDQLAAVRDQLRGTAEQLADARQGKRSADHKVEALTASVRRRVGVSIRPNSSRLETLPAINLPDVHVRRDGEVIRVALPGYQLFESGSARLRADADAVIGTAATEILRTYPDQIISIEGHTDSDPITGTQWRNNHELSIGRAMAVHDLLVSRTRFPASQLYVVGHGANRPIASNATPDGKKHNRRVELVIHPQKKVSGR